MTAGSGSLPGADANAVRRGAQSQSSNTVSDFELTERSFAMGRFK